MQLCYRGNKYNLQNNSIRTTETGITARFLRQSYTIRQANYRSPISSEVLKYRGNIYQK